MTDAATEAPPGLATQIRDLDDRFWIVNVMEMFERLAYYGVRSVVALYMVLPLELGGPEFTHIQKGNIFAAWAAAQSVLPAFTGGFADRYGHKRTIALAIVIKILGYLMMAWFTSYGLFFVGCLLLATGTAIFKPGVQGTLAATLKRSNASVGWGIFYQLVNVGGFLGPVLAGVLRLMDWKYVFYSCAVIVSINFLWLPFYKDPTHEASKEDQASDQTAAWSGLAQAVSARLATTWTMLFAAFTAVWFASLFFVAASVDAASVTGFGTAMGAVGVAFGAGATVVARARPSIASGLMAVAFVLSLTAIALDLHTAPIAALGASPLAWVGTLVFAGLYLAPTATLFGAVLARFAAKKDLYDQGRTDPFSVFVVSLAGLFQHRVLWFCLAFSGFWVMFNQVFDLLPNVIDDWVDSSGIIGTLGAAFTGATVPTALALGLGSIYGALCAAGVLLAMRPDRKDQATLSNPTYLVVFLGLLGACWFPVSLLAETATTAWLAPVLALGLTAAIRGLRAPARVVAVAALALGAVGSGLSLRASLLGAAPSLVEMAEAGQQVNPEWMINLNPGLITFTMVFFAYLSGYVRPLTSILVGMVVATAGSILAGTAVLGWVCLAGILVFSVGEMLSSPKKMEYLATLSKKGQEGLFMGYANIPVAIGWIAGSIFAGNTYEEHGDKANLARRHLEQVVGMDPAVVEALPKSEVLPTLAEALGMSASETTRLLFETYHPETLWIQIGAIGLVSILAMVIYDRAIRAGAASAEEKAEAA